MTDLKRPREDALADHEGQGPTKRLRFEDPSSSAQLITDGGESPLSPGFLEASTDAVDATEKRINSPDMRQCFRLLNELMDDINAPPYNHPVDWDALQLPGYPLIIKNPMDLGTIRELILSNQFEHPNHMADHVRLVFNNAMIFNLPGSGIYQSAEALLGLFNRQYKELFDSWFSNKTSSENDPGEETADDIKKANDEKEVIALQEKVSSVRSILEEMKKKLTKIKRRKNTKTTTAHIVLSAPREPLTYEQKEELCSLITQLTRKDLPGLIEIIRASTSHSDAGEGEVEIDIEEMDDGALLMVSRYVHRCLKQDSSKRKSGGARQRGGSKAKTNARSGRGKAGNKAGRGRGRAAVGGKKRGRAQSGSRSKFQLGKFIALNPPRGSGEGEGFWVGQISDNPNDKGIPVEWYELRPGVGNDPNVRWYCKSGNFDYVSPGAVLLNDIDVIYDKNSRLYYLPNSQKILSQI
jgi:hypothetical protein